MKDSTLTGANKSTKDASGLRSANEMTDTCPDKGWGGVEEVPGVDVGGNSPVRSASGSGIDFGGPVGGAPIMPSMSGSADDTDVSLTMLLDVGEQPGPTTGAGLRSAVGESPKS